VQLRKIWILAALFLLAQTAHAATVYVAQTAGPLTCNGGTQTAIAVASITWTAGNTYFLCGTFTYSGGESGAISVGGSGTSGNLITIRFDTGANATAPYWGSGGFITISGQGFILIDGSPTSTPCGYVNSADVACNGEIQATANGASLANQVANSHGINLGSGTHDIEVRNVNCQNLFVPVQNNTNNETTSGINNSACVWWYPSGGGGGGNINVHNNEVNNSFNGVLLAYQGSNAGMHVDNNWMTNIEVGAQVGAGTTGASITSGSINNNDFSNMANWDTSNSCGGSCPNHHEFVHLYTQQSGATITNFTVAGNYFHGTMGYSLTAGLYIECDGGGSCTAPTSINATVFNNVAISEDVNSAIYTGAGGNGIFAFEGSTVAAYNNTFYSVGHGSDLNDAMQCEAGALVTMKNNLFVGMSAAYNVSGSCTITSDYNDAFGMASFAYNTTCGSVCALSAWKTSTSQDTNTVTGNPNLNLSSTPEYQLSSGSAAAAVGVNLTSLSITGLDSDQLGNARPASTAWDMGAFNAGSGGPTGSSALGGIKLTSGASIQ
jgi:hypothetical protein